MKAKVIRRFRDKFNFKFYAKGDTYHGDEDRVAFLTKEGFLEAKSKQPPKEEQPKTKKKADKK